jgi:hypothetical protein
MTRINSQRFREEAHQCWELANKARDPLDKEAWLRLASDWKRLAENVEQIELARHIIARGISTRN